MRLAMLMVGVTAACAAPPQGKSSLVVTLPASMIACPNGGVEIDTGLDANGDGELEPSEVTSRDDVCAPPPATATPQQLVRVDAEAPGTNCSAGGVAVETGTDANANGTLDDSEVASVTYVCAGEDGAPGSNGAAGSDAANLLVRIDVEPAGANCALGGDAIRVGTDSNADGVLEDGEVQDTAYVCGTLPAPTVIDGDFVIANDLDVRVLANVTDVTGNLSVTSSTITSLSLPNLRHVGNVGVFTNALATLSLPALVSAGTPGNLGTVEIESGGSTLDLSSLTSAMVRISSYDTTLVSLPSLQTGDVRLSGYTVSLSTTLAHGTVYIEDAPKLTALSLDNFEDGSIFITEAAALQRLTIPAMTTGSGPYGAILIARAPQLAAISAPRLVAGDLDIQETPALTTLDVPALQSGAVQLTGTALTTLSLPALITAPSVVFENNPNLTSISAPSLGTGTGIFDAVSDPELPTCLAAALAAQCGAASVLIAGTDDAASCP